MTIPVQVFLKLKKLHFVFFWSGNWPLLDTAMNSDARYLKEFRRIAGTVPSFGIWFFKNRVATDYHVQEDYDRLEEYFKKKFSANPRFLVNSARSYRKRVNVDLKALKKVYKIRDFSKFSGRAIADLFMKARSHFSYNAAIDHYDWYMEKLFIPELRDYLAERLGKLGKARLMTEYVNTLITPHKVSVTFKERQDFFELVHKIRKSRKLTLARHQPIIARYLAKWRWMPVLVNNPPSNKKSIWKEIFNLIKTNAPLVIHAKRLGDNYDPRVLKRSVQYLRELKPPRRILDLIEGLRAMAFLRTEDYVVMSQSSYLVMPLYKEVAQRIGFTYRDLKEFLPEEIVGALQRNKKIAQSLLKNRLAFTAYVRYNNRRFVYTGSQARKLKNIMEMRAKAKSQQAKVSHGTAAYPGRVVGKVRLVLDPKSGAKIKAGEIAVGAFMSSGFVPLLRKAAGIVAEFGGLTSHPVIVAREFKIPCLVGVTGVTHTFKDGDRIELDASRGTVRKI